MKQAIRINTYLSVLFILLSFHLDAALIHFLLAGEIPGTNLVISPSLMMLGDSLLFALIIAVFVRSQKKQSRA